MLIKWTSGFLLREPTAEPSVGEQLGHRPHRHRHHALGLNFNQALSRKARLFYNIQYLFLIRKIFKLLFVAKT